MKIRLFIFARNMDIIYRLLMCLKRYRRVKDSARYKVGCNRDVLGVIRSYMVETVHLPTSQFAVSDIFGLYEQLHPLLKSGEEKNPRV